MGGPQDKLILRMRMAEMMNRSYSQPMTATERVKGGASVLPVVGDAISGYDAYQSFKKGNYGEAALNAIGMLPMIPSLGMVTKGHIDDILKAMSSGGSGSYGLRVTDEAVNVGDVLPSSFKWKDGNRTDKVLKGTSTIGIKGNTDKSIIEALKGLDLPPRSSTSPYYFGDNVVLVKGEQAGKGVDVGERLIKDAKVLHLMKKYKNGKSDLIP